MKHTTCPQTRPFAASKFTSERGGSRPARARLAAYWLCLLALLAGCAGESEGEPESQLKSKQQAVWVNGDFEDDTTGIAPSGWTVQNFLNPGVTQVTPQTFASLNLTAGGSAWTYVIGGAAETQTDPDLGATASLRFPKYGIRAARANYLNASNKGLNQNTNVLSQLMTTSLGDVDPTDDKVHVRFALAPVLENPNHGYTDQPYYYVELVNTTTGQTLYQDFNTSGQVGVPWRSDGASASYLYTNWQLVDIAPGNSAIRVGDQLRLRVVGAGCALGGHWGRVYLDAVGSGIPGLFTWMTGVQSANASSDLTYTVNYKNGGTSTTSGTKLDFVTPPNTTFRSVSTPGSCTAPAAGATGTVSCTLGSLSQGAVGTYTITVRIGAVATGTIITNGNYNIYATGVNPLIGPKVQTTVTSGVTYANVGISKSDGVAALTWGQAVDYTVVVSNAGPAAAPTVTVADTIPAQLTGVTWTCTTQGGATCASSGSGNISDSLSLPVGGVATYRVIGSVVAGSGTSSVSNSATATVAGGVSDPDNGDNTAIDINAIGSLRTLTMTKTAGSNGGAINSTPSSINCGTSCSADSGSFIDGTQVILTASPVAGSTFLGWGGACAGTANSCTLVMSGDQTVTASFTPAPTIAVNGGSGQATLRSAVFGTQLAAQVLDSAGSPLVGATVYFSVPGSGASATLSGSSAVTNASGIASVTATANATSGSYVVSASSASATGVASFALSNYGPASTLSIAAGGTQSATVVTAFATPLRVVVRDSSGVAVPNATVSYAAAGAGASATLSASSAVTDANGQASITATANTTAGAHNVSATVPGVATPVQFALTNTAGAPSSISINGGDGQSALVTAAFATQLSVLVRDAQNNPVNNVTVTFTPVPNGGATATMSASATTNALGVAALTATANNRRGSYTVSASVAGVATPASFALTNNAAAAATITTSAGTPQSTTVGSAFGTSLVALVADSYGNPVPSVNVTFSVPGSGASAVPVSSTTVITSSSGLASLAFSANNIAGSYAVTASTAGVATPASFALTNQAGAPATLVLGGGNSQSAVVTQAFATALTLTVVDSQGNTTPGIMVTFAVPGSGASAGLSAASVVTNGAGQAGVTATANQTAGSYLASASVAGVASPLTFALTNTPGAATSLTVAGSGQSTTVLTAFAVPLTVTLRDAFSNPVPGQTVNYSAPGSAATASLSAASGVSDAAGQTSVLATANGGAGSYSVSVASGALSGSFALTNSAGAAASLSITAGSGQSTPVTQAFATALTVRVRDAQNNPVAGNVVSFSAPGAGASAALSGLSATTDASGSASITATANTIAGSYQVQASAAGVATPQTFSLSNTPGAATSLTVSGSGQNTTVLTAFGSPLIATLRDAQNNPVPGLTVNYGAPASAATASLSAASAVTDAAGQTSVSATANGGAGNYSVSVSVAALSGSFALTNSAGAPASVGVTGGSSQDAIVSQAFTSALTVRVLDAQSNPIAGRVVSFSAPASGASAGLSSATATTDAAGYASVTAIANNVAGSYQAEASVVGVATPAVFALRNLAGAASSLLLTSGSGQSATVNTNFAAPLLATVVDAYGNPVAGTTVDFSAPAVTGPSGVLNQASDISDVLGQVSVDVTAGQHAGSYDISASLASPAVSVNFALSNTVGTASAIRVAAGDAQSTTISTAFATQLQALVVDAFDNPLPGIAVTFTGPASGASASLSPSSGVTDGSGRLSITATANTVAGSYTVQASAAGVATPASFALSNQAGSAATLSLVGGNSQSAVVTQGFATALSLTVRDGQGNPAPGVTVSFSVPGSGASTSLSASSAVTDATGQVSVSATANQTAGSYTAWASVSGVASPLNFALTNTAGAATSLTVSGSGQSTTVLAAFGAPLTVTLRDAYANPVPALTVSYVVPGTPASASLSQASGVTDATGQTSVLATANDVAGSYAVGVSSGPLSGSFSLTNTPGLPGSVSVAGGSAQDAIVTQAFASALTVQVLDAQNNPIVGEQVSFAAPASGASATLSSASAITDSAGQASITVSANTLAGGYVVQASVSGVGAPASFTLRNLAGSASSLLLTSGSGQSATVSTNFGAPLLATVVDAYGNPVAGETVSFSAPPATGATAVLAQATDTSDTAGLVSVDVAAGQRAGSYSVTAALASPQVSVSFALANAPGAVGAISVVGGGTQSATVDSNFGAALEALVVDGFGNPLSGVLVTFGSPASGATATLSQSSAITDLNGRVSVSARANTISGSYAIAASAPGAGASTFTLSNVPGSATRIAAQSGGGQSAKVQTAFGAALLVAVYDAFDNLVPSAPVTFSAPASGPSALLASPTVTTNTLGQASTTLSANDKAGSYQVQASLQGGSASVSFSLGNVAGDVGSISVGTGGAQRATVRTAFASPLQVIVRDSFGNPVPGAAVNFELPSTGPSASLSALTLVTDSAGEASVTAVANPEAGSYLVSASATGAGSSANFALSNDPGAAASIETLSGAGQSATVNQPFASELVAQVLDQDRNPVPAANVSFLVPATGASAVLNVSALVSDGAGLVRVAPTANAVAGSYAVRARIDIGTEASFPLTNTAGAVGSIALVSGDAQRAVVDQPFAQPLEFVVRDADSNPVPGVGVTLTVPVSGASAILPAGPFFTDAQGLVSITATANRVAGNLVINASAPGAASPARLTLTNTPAVPSQLLLASGNSQSTVVLSVFAQRLGVRLLDVFDNPVPGVTVAFAAPGTPASSTLSAATVTTDVDGLASVQATASRVAGSYVVSANAASLPAISFSLTNTAGPVGSISLSRGTGQRAQVTQAFALPLEVLVLDAEGNAVEGASVSFSVPSADASATLDRLLVSSDANGLASVSATANTLAGDYTVTAVTSGAATPAQFNLRNLPAAAASIALVSGSPQSAVVSTPFPGALRAVVRDQHGNRVPGVSVTIEAPSAGPAASVSSPQSLTGADGEVTVTAVANTLAGGYEVLMTVAGVSAPLPFALTNLAAAPASLTLLAGDEQSAPVTEPFASELRVIVRDASGNPVPNIEVRFGAPASGASAELGTPVQTTNAQGEANTPAIANTLAGSYVVTASVSSLSDVPFSLHNLVGTPTQLVVQGSGQSSEVNSAFVAPIIVLIRDAQGNPVPGVSVLITKPDSGPSAQLVSETVLTGDDGRAVFMAAANDIAGDYTLQITAAGLSGSVMLTNIEDPCRVDPDDLRCAEGDADHDGVPNDSDDSVSDPCLPDPGQAYCASGDADGDGIPNGVECSTPGDCIDSDGDGTPDYLDTDSDQDGLSDAVECKQPAQCEDYDQDGLPDYIESNVVDTDGDGDVDAHDEDSDGDGVSDREESAQGGRLDLDGDGIPGLLDADEDGPGAGDSDEDGLPDDLECAGQLPCRDTDRDGVPDYADPDSDGDGLSDKKECPNPASCPDKDGDGTPDVRDPAPISAKGGACSAGPGSDISGLLASLLGALALLVYRRLQKPRVVNVKGRS